MGVSDASDLILQLLLAIALVTMSLAVVTSWLNHRSQR